MEMRRTHAEIMSHPPARVPASCRRLRRAHSAPAGTTGYIASGEWEAEPATSTVSFTAGHIESAEAGWVIDGTLRVKDRACPMRLNVAAPVSLPSDPRASVELRATGRVDRRSAGVTAAPALLVGHQVAIALTVWLRPPATSLK